MTLIVFFSVVDRCYGGHQFVDASSTDWDHLQTKDSRYAESEGQPQAIAKSVALLPVPVPSDISRSSRSAAQC